MDNEWQMVYMTEQNRMKNKERDNKGMIARL